MVRALRAMKNVHGNTGEGTMLRRLVAIRVDPKGYNPQNEQYFLVRPTKKPWVARERCHVAGSNTPKGTTLFEANYFVCGDLEQNTGNRTYTVMTGPTSVVTLPLSAVVHNLGDIAFHCTKQTPDGQAVWVLHSDLHDRILAIGSLTATNPS